MESIQILDEKALAEISLQATKYTHLVIDHDPEVNAETIYDLKRQLLIALESNTQLRKDYQKQIERSEKRCAERIKHALKAQSELVEQYTIQIEGLKKQIR